VTFGSRLEVEIWSFCSCAVKNMQCRNMAVFCCAMKSMQYNPYLCPNGKNFHILKEIGVEQHDGDVRF